MFSDDFLDVTLACVDGQRIKTHKVILLSSSPLDRKMGINYKVDSTTKWTQLQSGLTTKWTQLQSGTLSTECSGMTSQMLPWPVKMDSKSELTRSSCFKWTQLQISTIGSLRKQ